MAIPLATTTIAVLRTPADPDRDPYDPQPDPTAIATGVRAHISTSHGRENVAGAQQEIVELRLTCDPTDLTHKDVVLDEFTGEQFDVSWVKHRTGLGLAHVAAGIRSVTGVT